MISNKIRDFHISVSELASAFNCTRPTVYSYIKAYDARRYGLLPDPVKDIFDFIDISEYLSSQNLFVLLHGGNPRKPLGEGNPLFVEGRVFIKSNCMKKIFSELKKEHSFPERKGRYVYVIRKVLGDVRITFVLLDMNMDPENKSYARLTTAKEVNSLEEINEIFKHEAVRVLSEFQGKKNKQLEASYLISHEEAQNFVKDFDENAKNLEHFNRLRKKVVDYVYNLKYQSRGDIEKLEIIQKLLDL